MKIIIVEDEKSIRNGLVKMLPKLDPEYEVIGSAKEGFLEEEATFTFE